MTGNWAQKLKAGLRRVPVIVWVVDKVRRIAALARLYAALCWRTQKAVVRIDSADPAEGDPSHPMRDPLFTFARLSDDGAEFFWAQCQEDGQIHRVGFFRNARQITFVNSYMDLPESALLAILGAIVCRFGFVTKLQVQRSPVAYPFLTCRSAEEYVADVTCGLESYLAALSKKTRFNIRYYSKKLVEEVPGLRFRHVMPGGLQRHEFEAFVRMVQKRYPGDYWAGFLAEDIFERFSQVIVGTIVQVDGAFIAFNLFFVHGKEWLFTGNSFDETYAKYSLGFVTTFHSIELAQKVGVDRVILGLGDYGYKSRLSNATQGVYEYSL